MRFALFEMMIEFIKYLNKAQKCYFLSKLQKNIVILRFLFIILFGIDKTKGELL